MCQPRSALHAWAVEETENLRRREIKFDLNKLAQVAADSVGAALCISIKKYPDGMFNKSFLVTMEDDQEVVAKVPNPNAGVPHFTTASEVATMDLITPHVHAWNSRAKLHPVGTEFIIMDKVEGVPLSEVCDTMQLQQKLKVILAMTSPHKKWLSVSFSHYGSLYYAGDVQSPTGNHCVNEGMAINDSEFAIGPATGRDWFDAGRSVLDIERGPWASLTQYLQAVGAREIKAIQSLKPPKQIALFVAQSSTNLTLQRSSLHPHNSEKITGIIDWQSCHISPLFNHNPDPAFLYWDGLEPETLDLPERLTLSGLSTEERSAAMCEYIVQNVFIGWRKLMHAKNPDLYRVVEFRKTPAYWLIFLAHRMFEYGEAHFLSLLVDLKDTWADLPGVTRDTPFPFDFSEEDLERIRLDSDDAIAGTELASGIKEKMGDLWPDKGFIEYERYDDCKAALDELKGQMLDQLAETDEDKAEYQRHWPIE
ncbi:phosphotransferase enzyme family protein [Penicillium desertorum]|uniref:Phosphotransferase enzyme family protein n=1 Tax=Penicillium desertorum TaxID=1303715 RepID=A0A9W9WVU2_9EURO|nr:phosphotransferase enzyme family protein [Penicillium desertorum]